MVIFKRIISTLALRQLYNRNPLVTPNSNTKFPYWLCKSFNELDIEHILCLGTIPGTEGTTR